MPDPEPLFVRLFTPTALVVAFLFVLEAMAVWWLTLRWRAGEVVAIPKRLRHLCVLAGFGILTGLAIYTSVVVAFYREVSLPRIRQHEASQPLDREPRRALQEKVRRAGLAAGSAYVGFIVSAFSWTGFRKAEKELGRLEGGRERFDATRRIEPS
jgi:hypothetical protein